MLKLLKYNFLNFWKKHLFVVLIITINLMVWKVLNVLTNNDKVNQSLLLVIINFESITTLILIISMIALPVITLILSIIRYKKKVLGDESYLTHTLPVEKRDILDASILNLLIFIIIDAVIIILAAGLRFGFDEITYFIRTIVSNNIFEMFLIIALLVITFATLFNQVILALTLGYSKETNKVKNTIIFGILIYFANQILGSVMMGIIFLFTYISNIEMTRIILVAIPLFYLFVFIATYLLIDKTLNNKLNLE